MTQLITDMDEIFFRLEQALDPIHRGFTFDSNQKRIYCADCGWEQRDLTFLPAVAAHHAHRRTQQQQVLDAFRGTLT